jgi:ABC-type oligopeptide transport system substrate-binding subunit
MLRTRTLFAAVAIAAMSLLAACGDSGDSTEGGADTTAGPASNDPVTSDPAANDTVTNDTTAVAGNDPVTSDTAAVPTGPGKDTEFCQYQAELNNMSTPFDDQNSGAAEFETYFKELVNPAIDKLQATAPAEIKAQMDTLAEGLRKFSAAFEKSGWDPEKAYADPELTALAGDTAYNEAGSAVDEFCGF